MIVIMVTELTHTQMEINALEYLNLLALKWCL